jgi:hypothetical protein
VKQRAWFGFATYFMSLIGPEGPGSIHLAFIGPQYYDAHLNDQRLLEANMTRLQKTWITLFTLTVVCSMLLSNVAFALNDPK